MIKHIRWILMVCGIALVIFNSCSSEDQKRYLIVSETTHFEIQGNGSALNLPIFAGTLGVEKIVRDVSLAEYYQKKLSSVYSFKSFTFIENIAKETLLDRAGKLHEPQPVYTFKDSAFVMDLSLVLFENNMAQYAFRITDKKTGQIRDHIVEVPDGKSASIGTMFDPERNHGHLVSVSMQCLPIDRHSTPEQLAAFLKQKNSLRGSTEPAKFHAGDQKWMDEIFGAGKMTLPVETIAPSKQNNPEDNPATFVKFDQAPQVIEQFPVDYPEAAKRDSVEGKVLVRVFVDSTGTVQKYLVALGVRADLDSAVIASVQKWRFTPATVDGKNISVWIAIPFNFKINK